jgi:DNA-binding CsgD family transcriptional regulator
MSSLTASRARDAIERLSVADLTWEEFAEETLEVLARAVPFEAATMAPFDSQTGLITGSVKRAMPSDSYARFAHFEYTAPDAHSFAQLAKRARPVGVLVDDLDGDPARAERYREFYLPSLSLGHEVRVGARSRGMLWGGVSLFREVGSHGFTADEVDLLDGAIDAFVRGFRRGVARGLHLDSVRAEPAVLIVDASNTLAASTGDRAGWFAQLDPTRSRPLPIAVVSAIVRARQRGEAAITVRAGLYGWATVRASMLQGAGGAPTGQVVVTLGQAAVSSAVPLVVAALGMTDRERQIIDLVLAGRSTVQIASELFLSPHTVQDHLKSIFAKAKVRSRRDLVALLQV